MKIRYLDGPRLYHAFLAGGNAVIQDQDYLNKINVFPVPDADTGTNLASTMKSIARGAVASRTMKGTWLPSPRPPFTAPGATPASSSPNISTASAASSATSAGRHRAFRRIRQAGGRFPRGPS